MLSAVKDCIEYNDVRTLQSFDYWDLIPDAYNYVRLIIQYGNVRMLKYSLETFGKYLYPRFEEMIINDLIPNQEYGLIMPFINDLTLNDRHHIESLMLASVEYIDLLMVLVDKFPSVYEMHRGDFIEEMYVDSYYNRVFIEYDLNKFGDYRNIEFSGNGYRFSGRNLEDLFKNKMSFIDKDVFSFVHDSDSLAYFIENILQDVNVVGVNNINLVGKIIASDINVEKKYQLIETLINKNQFINYNNGYKHPFISIKDSQLKKYHDIFELILADTSPTTLATSLRDLCSTHATSIKLLSYLIVNFKKYLSKINPFDVILKTNPYWPTIIELGEILIREGYDIHQEKKYIKDLHYQYDELHLPVIKFIVRNKAFNEDEVVYINERLLVSDLDKSKEYKEDLKTIYAEMIGAL